MVLFLIYSDFVNRRIPKHIHWIIGIDEVGRGPIAGPLVMGAWVCHVSAYKKLLEKHAVGVKDSKQLSEKAREAWYEILNQLIRCNAPLQKISAKYFFYKVSVSAKMIDTRGMGWALCNCVAQLLKASGQRPDRVLVLLDGGLKAPEEFRYQETIIKGDQKEPIISAASIMAKVSRDRYMKRLHIKFPNYGFDQHKGYGTRKHYQMIKKYGPSEYHRLSWL
jgi:ribonuclease HII